MNIVVLCNPSSGQGLAEPQARSISTALEHDGHLVRVLTIQQAGADGPGSIARSVRGADLLVVVGGDGTLHYVLGEVARVGVPVYQVPHGTENLFAREFGMDRRIATLRQAIARGNCITADLGVVSTDIPAGPDDPPQRSDRPFALMCSVGVDANVVHKVAAGRRGAITRWTYARPALAELVRPRYPLLHVVVDSEEVVGARKGLVVIANCRQYAARLDPAARAAMNDGQLDIVFLPWGASLITIALAVLARMRLLSRVPGVIYARGQEVELRSLSGPTPMQIDGEAAGVVTDQPVRFSVRPAALRVVDARPWSPIIRTTRPEPAPLGLASATA